MTYQETIDFLYAQLPMFSRVGSSAYKKDLTNTIALCEYFNNPQSRLKSIHIGGTNGKGSTTNYFASVLIENGLKVGIYTSPHLVDFRERIKIGNEYVSEQFVIDFVEKAKPVIEKVRPSFFELTVVMAFEYFANQHVDIVMIEVGLGGRLDSTNVIQPMLSIITNVTFDHMNMLGNTLNEIATEKAGIIKENTPIVIGEYQKELFPIFLEKANQELAPIFCAENDVFMEESEHITFSFEKFQICFEKSIAQPSYKLKNIRTVFRAYIELIQSGLIDVSEDSIGEVFVKGIENFSQNTNFLGRWTRMKKANKSIILECAHNEAGIEELKKSLENEEYRNLYVVYGTVNDKDISKIISLLPRANNIHYILTQADIPRALPVEDLEQKFIDSNFENFTSISSAPKALDFAIHSASEKDLILVTGSIFLVGELLPFI